ncbi:isoprenoid synthase domain-containing protein [Triangularia setosa]|uniref:Isoprenoid synthase domain-containing protein n=1 Tax=Triangularia setosa TaxID=2587417 RepID=A0AAN6VYZ9_9PEZI|nr:isoprenoid synthase domain-containing protein [Podospora setosa]
MARNDYFQQPDALPTAETVYLSQYAHTEAAGFCHGYPLARHGVESEANKGSHEARQDWIKYIGCGPVGEYGGCNPADGHFCALVLPMCKPERLRLVSYLLESSLLLPNISLTPYLYPQPTTPNGSTTSHPDAFTLSRCTNIESGRKHLQSKMMQQLLATDTPCAERIITTWKTMLSTTLKQKSEDFVNLDEYLDFRIIDTGAPFVEATMLFGMGLGLPQQDKALLDEMTRPCFASLALANDYFSFDREYTEFYYKEEKEEGRLINAVWLCMKWHGVGVEVAKGLVREACNGYEREFLRRCEGFLGDEKTKDKEKWRMYFKGLQHQVSGNVVWSLRCPRYHSNERGFDPNAGVEDAVTARMRNGFVAGKNEEDKKDGNWWGMGMYHGEHGLEVTSPGVEAAM